MAAEILLHLKPLPREVDLSESTADHDQISVLAGQGGKQHQGIRAPEEHLRLIGQARFVNEAP